MCVGAGAAGCGWCRRSNAATDARALVYQGLKRWPFRRRREAARRNALMSQASGTPSTLSRTSPEDNSQSTDGINDKSSPPLGARLECQVARCGGAEGGQRRY